MGDTNGRWAGVAELRGEPRGYLLDTSGTAWGELEWLEEEDHWDEDAGEWRIPVVARFVRDGQAVVEKYPMALEAALAVARGADSPWPLEVPLASPATARNGLIINGLLAGLRLWDVEWSVPLLDGGYEHRHPFTRVLAADESGAVAYARDFVLGRGDDPEGMEFEPRPSSKDL